MKSIITFNFNFSKSNIIFPNNIFIQTEQTKALYEQDFNQKQLEVDKWRKENGITVIGDYIPDPIISFSDLPFKQHVLSIFKSCKFIKPTAIQSQCWPIILSNRDVALSSQTGSGKTLTFMLPCLEHVYTNPNNLDPVALILVPTRDLAIQIQENTLPYINEYGIKLACIYGGYGNRKYQINSLKERPQIIIATPGRLIDFYESKLINLSSVNFIVIDEADKMLDLNFKDSIKKVIFIYYLISYFFINCYIMYRFCH